MSEQPSSVAPSRAGGRGNIFTQKIGPLPMWAWVGIAGAILVVWRMYASKQASAASTAANAASNTASTAASTVPQFVNQTYTTVTAPSAPTQTATPPTSHHMPGKPWQPPSNPGAEITPDVSTTGPFYPTAATPSTAPVAPKPAANIPSVAGLRATGAGATNVGLAWNPVPGATQYQVRVTYQNNVVKTFMTNGTSYNVTGLSPNRTYGLHVVAINGSDWAPEASIVQKTT